MEWNSINTAPTETRILVLCQAYKCGGYAIFETRFEDGDDESFLVPCPQSKEENWIDCVWTPIAWSEKSSVFPPWAKK
jgi:hypothetical protein